jgi:hypothetical protein
LHALRAAPQCDPRAQEGGGIAQEEEGSRVKFTFGKKKKQLPADWQAPYYPCDDPGFDTEQ